MENNMHTIAFSKVVRKGEFVDLQEIKTCMNKAEFFVHREELTRLGVVSFMNTYSFDEMHLPKFTLAVDSDEDIYIAIKSFKVTVELIDDKHE
jgi:hypothetical protein